MRDRWKRNWYMNSCSPPVVGSMEDCLHFSQASRSSRSGGTLDSSSGKSPEWTVRYIWQWKRNTSNLLGSELSNVSGMCGLIEVLDFCDGHPLILLARSCKVCARSISSHGDQLDLDHPWDQDWAHLLPGSEVQRER